VGAALTAVAAAALRADCSVCGITGKLQSWPRLRAEDPRAQSWLNATCLVASCGALQIQKTTSVASHVKSFTRAALQPGCGGAALMLGLTCSDHMMPCGYRPLLFAATRCDALCGEHRPSMSRTNRFPPSQPSVPTGHFFIDSYRNTLKSRTKPGVPGS